MLPRAVCQAFLGTVHTLNLHDSSVKECTLPFLENQGSERWSNLSEVTQLIAIGTQAFWAHGLGS